MTDTETRHRDKNNAGGIMSAMRQAEDILEDSQSRVDAIEKKLASKLLTLENRARLVRELEEVKELLRKNRERLQGLRGENTRSFMLAAAIAFAAFLLYGLYCFFRNIG